MTGLTFTYDPRTLDRLGIERALAARVRRANRLARWALPAAALAFLALSAALSVATRDGKATALWLFPCLAFFLTHDLIQRAARRRYLASRQTAPIRNRASTTLRLDATGITAAFDALRGGEGLDFGPVSGTLVVAEGQVNVSPITRQDEVADVEVKTVAELALAQIDMDVSLTFKGEKPLPPMSVSYAGPPDALARAEDNSQLSAALGVTIMQQGISELERLQLEQERLTKLEEQQRIEDEARLQAYYAQRDELLLRRRELKVHAEMQVMEADRLRRQIDAERAANGEINKIETRQRLRELRTWRRLARLAERTRPAAVQEPVNTAAEIDRTPARKPAEPVGPVILEQPQGAPVIISPSPDSPPSQ